MAATEPQAATPKRDLLLQCARNLFAREGYHATGVDRILDQAGVAKMTLYNHFGSKEQLIVAVIDDASQSLVDELRAWTARSDDPFEQVLLIFDALAARFERPDGRGCLIQAAAAEFSDLDSPVGQAIRRHHDRVQSLLLGIARATECADAPALAARLGLLIAGALSTARTALGREPAEQAKRIAEILLEDACRRPATGLE